jgi:NAD(P)-dependent dehydrogenase (short-subunit alcohol dehydrogenase family)
VERLKGKTALITGGARGIGFTMAKTFLAEGAAVGIIDINDAALASAASELAPHGRKVSIVKADLATKAGADSGFDTVTQALGAPVDVLVNNAAFNVYQQLHELTEENVDRMLAIDFKAILWMCRRAAPSMIERKAGSIINLSSIAALTGVGYSLVYAAVKAAVDGFTRALAIDLGLHGVRVNSIAPSAIPSEMSRSILDESGWEGRRRRTPLGRIGTPGDIANAALFLASDESSFITGEVLRVDGGYVIGGAIPGVDVPMKS